MYGEEIISIRDSHHHILYLVWFGNGPQQHKNQLGYGSWITGFRHHYVVTVPLI